MGRHNGSGEKMAEPIVLKPKFTVLYAIIIALAIIALAILAYFNFTGDVTGDYFLLFSIGIVALAVLALLAYFLKYLAVSYRVTDREIVMSEGIITKTTRVVPTHKIDNISVKRDIQDLILMTGSIHVDTPAGAGATEIIMRRIDSAKLDQVGDMIRKIIHKESHEHGPEERAHAEPEEKAWEEPAKEYKPAKKKKKGRK